MPSGAPNRGQLDRVYRLDMQPTSHCFQSSKAIWSDGKSIGRITVRSLVKLFWLETHSF